MRNSIDLSKVRRPTLGRLKVIRGYRDGKIVEIILYDGKIISETYVKANNNNVVSLSIKPNAE